MWSAFAEANASHNYVWMLNIYKRFKLLSVIGSFVCLFIAVIFRQIVNLWLGNGTITVNFSYSLLFAILISITLFINSSTSVANAMNELNCQIIWTVIGAIIKNTTFFRYGKIFRWMDRCSCCKYNCIITINDFSVIN